VSEVAGERVSVLLVDDHAIVRQGVRAFLETQPDLEVVGEADSGEAAVRLAGEVAPDVALVDLLMPGIGGVEAIRQLKRHSPHTQVVALTSYHTDEHVFAALRAGALSYVLKDVGAGELADVIRRAARGESVLHPQVAARVVQALRGDRDVPNLFVELSERELEVLRLIAAGLANATIAERLFISEKTVKGHVSNILGKLHILDRTQAAVLAWEQGLVQRRGPSA
jgi:NarL family two-component system response regulator LiaR